MFRFVRMESRILKNANEIFPRKKVCCFDTVLKYKLYINNNHNIMIAKNSKVEERSYIMLHHLSPFFFLSDSGKVII